MRIEKLLPPPQPGKPWSVALEGGEVLRVSESVVASFALYGGMELEAETLTALQEAAALAAWREKAGRLLTARMLSSGQLAEKLTAKGATEEQAAQVVAWAQDIGLLDDSAYAKALARHYTAKGYGPYKIKDEFYPEDPAQIKKASDALVRRGFSWHTVSQAVTRFLNGTDPW